MGRRYRNSIEQARCEDQQRIVMKIIRMLGRPPLLARIDVKHLFGFTYRVNVLVRDPSAPGMLEQVSLKIEHSYFVTEYAPNLELECDPPVKRRYGRG